MLKKIILILLVLAIPLWTAVGWMLNDYWKDNQGTVEEAIPPAKKVIRKPLQKYSIESMSNTQIPEGEFEIVEQLTEEDGFNSHKFKFSFLPTLEGEDVKTTTGLINIPEDANNNPLVVMIRGWAPEETYTHGVGTWRASEVFAQNGFITVAPDFLGYADSDENAADIFESRFQTYSTVLTLIKSLDQIEGWDKENLFIWAHSNGGQIALTSLAVLENDPPTTLWAPVSEFFPYSVLYYTNESDDRGKLIRKELAKFEELYDVEKYSFDNYLESIDAPIQIHQGTGDDAIPLEWTNDTVNELRELDKDVIYYTYSGADHNLRPDWDMVVDRDLEFFKDHLK